MGRFGWVVVTLVAIGCGEKADESSGGSWADEWGDSDSLKDLADGEMCLNTLLEMAGLTRADLEGSGADEILAHALAAQEDVLGTSIVVDCEAQESVSAISDASAAAEPPEDAEGEEPPREPETTEIGSSDQVGGAVLGAVQSGSSEGMEVAILLDTTGSMRDDEVSVREAIEDIITEVENNNGFIALASYGDLNCDDPWYGINEGGLIDLSGGGGVMATTKDDLFSGIVQTGGCDWPESLYGGIWETADRLDWKSQNRRIIAITDATPLEPPKTTYSAEMVADKLNELGISLDTILVGISY